MAIRQVVRVTKGGRSPPAAKQVEITLTVPADIKSKACVMSTNVI